MARAAVLQLIAAFTALSQLRVEYYNEYYKTDLLEEYDFIVVGSGSTGSIVAGRLSEIKNVTVLLLEAGECGRGDINIDVPLYTPKLHGSKRDWGFTVEPLIHANFQTLPYPRGKVGGGSGSINYMNYVRGLQTDYDSWAEQGLPGWSFQEVKPFFAKVENGSAEGLSLDLGRNGKVKLTRGFYYEGLYQVIEDAFGEIGYSPIDLVDNGGMKEGVSKFLRTIYNGVRQTSIGSYIWPVWEERKSRLHLAFNSLVHKVLLQTENGVEKAYGVKVERNGEIIEIKARNEIILSAGAINTPQLLMLSGIGPKEHLDEFGITTKINSPGVGMNLQDHPGSFFTYFGSEPSNLTMNNKQIVNTFPQYITKGKSPMTSGLQIPVMVSLDVFKNSDVRTKNSSIPNTLFYIGSTSDEARLSKTYKQYAAHVKRQGKGRPTLFDAYFIVMRPKSRGSIKLKSSNIKDAPKIDSNILAESDDLEMLMEGYNVMEKIENSETFKKYNLTMVVDTLPCNWTENKFTPRSKEFYKCHLKTVVFGTSHACCTAKMGSDEDSMAVLDVRLRVRGVSGLRVADASIMPDIVSANTQAACFMIGEKAAHMIKEDWSLY